eukprot:UN19950
MLSSASSVRVDISHATGTLDGDWKSICPAVVQPNLRYNMSETSTFGLIIPVPADESLSDAVCCDANFLPYAT